MPKSATASRPAERETEDYQDTGDGEWEDEPEPDEPEEKEAAEEKDYAGQGAGRGAGGAVSRRGQYVDGYAHVRPSDNEGPDTTATLEPLTNATAQDWLGSNQDPDVLLSVPNLGVDRIGLTVKNVRAHVELHAKVLDLVELHVGADVGIEEVLLEIDNVRVQAMLKVKLEKVRDIVSDVVGLLDNHPEILTSLTGGLGRGLEGALARKPPEEIANEGDETWYQGLDESKRQEIDDGSDNGSDNG